MAVRNVRLILALGACAFAFAGAAHAAESLTVTMKGLDAAGRIPPRHAFCKPDKVARSVDGGNISPEISWSKGPEGTKSYAILMHDTDVPNDFADANKPHKTLPEDMPRKEFTHWVLVDLPASQTRMPAGGDSNRVEKAGKRMQKTRYGLRGVNDFGTFMSGEFYGYDGPCPPWNDERLHHYHFTVYALDVPSLKLNGAFTREDALKAMKGHILAKGEAVGTYTQNPALLKETGQRY